MLGQLFVFFFFHISSVRTEKRNNGNTQGKSFLELTLLDEFQNSWKSHEVVLSLNCQNSVQVKTGKQVWI